MPFEPPQFKAAAVKVLWVIFKMNTEDIEIVEVEDQDERMRMFVMDGGMQSATYINKDRRNDLIFKYMIRFGQLSELNKEAEKV